MDSSKILHPGFMVKHFNVKTYDWTSSDLSLLGSAELALLFSLVTNEYDLT